MAQGKRSRTAQRGKTARSRSTRNRAIAAKKATKHRSAKASPRKKLAKAKTKRIVAKLTQPKTAKLRKELPIEVVKVEQVDEPAPGVVVVSELESVRVGPAPVSVVPNE
jgi:hypothetical protein